MQRKYIMDNGYLIYLHMVPTYLHSKCLHRCTVSCVKNIVFKKGQKEYFGIEIFNQIKRYYWPG